MALSKYLQIIPYIKRDFSVYLETQDMIKSFKNYYSKRYVAITQLNMLLFSLEHTFLLLSEAVLFLECLSKCDEKYAECYC